MPDNQSVTIGADTSKFRGELKLLQAELANLDRQIKGAVKAGDTARAKELSNTFGVMKDKAVSLDRSLKDLGRSGSRAFNEVRQSADRANESVNITARSTGRLFRQLRSLRGIGGFGGSLIGGGIGGGVGFAASSALSELISQFGEIAKSMREIRDLARQTGVKPLMVQGLQELAKERGESAETANKFLTGVSATIAGVATKTRDATKSATQDFATFGDKTVQVMRGASQAVRDFSEPLDILQVDQEKMAKLPADKQMRVLADAFKRAEQNAKQLRLSEIQLNEISKSVFHVPREEADKIIAVLAELDAKTAELAASQRGATKKTLDDLDQSAGAWEKLSQQIQEAWAAITKNTAKAQAGLADSSREFLRNLPQTLMQVILAPLPPDFKPFQPLKDEANTLPAFFAQMIEKIRENFKKSPFSDPQFHPFEPLKEDANTLPPFFQGLTTTMEGIWKGFWGLFISEAKAATLDVKGSMAQIQADAQKADATLKDVQVTASAAGMPTVHLGPGTGPTGGYGPASFNQSTGYGPGSRPTQSILPGVSDYQAPPPKMVSPSPPGTAPVIKTAAEASADAAYAARTAAEASAKAVNAWVDQPFRYAEGGMVHGPGTPTSDSVTARLSAGEFVMRAAAVQRWGPQFMQALNGMGGRMPSRGIPSFASGGMVTAGGPGGGAVVNLVFNGNSFALRADNAIVGGLTREARRAGMMAGGRPAGLFQ